MTAATPFHVSAHGLAFVAGFRAKPPEYRHALEGVHVQPHPSGGVLLAATNAHQLAVFYDANGATDAAHVLRITPGLVTACRARTASRVHLVDGRLVAHQVEHHLRHETGLFAEPSVALETFVQPGRPWLELSAIDKFPDYLKLLPKDPDLLVEGALGLLNADYLAKACTAAAWLHSRTDQRRMPAAVTHWSDGREQHRGRGLVITRIAGLDHAIVATAPMRHDSRIRPLPNFTAAKA